MSIDYFGANVTPDSLREVLYGIDALAPVLSTFRLLSYEDDLHNKQMEVAVELIADAAAEIEVAALSELMFRRLAEINGDLFNALYRTEVVSLL